MLKNNACDILNIKRHEKITIELVKKKYKYKALQFHPDKNNSKTASDEFIKIHEAYETLLNECNNKTSFINKIEINSINYIKKFMNLVDVDTLKILYKLLKTNQEVLQIPNKIIDLLFEKINSSKYIILNPKIDDLFENNVYKLTIDNKKYIIPLWHDELTYEHNNNDIIIKNVPNLPNNISIDNNNNVIILLEYKINEIWNNDVYFNIGNKNFSIKKDDIRLLKEQIIILKNKGISKINTKDIFDISNKSNIIIKLFLNI